MEYFMNALTNLAINVAPEIAKWLSESDTSTVAAAVAQVAQAVTGTADEGVQQQIIARDPSIAAQFRLQLARIAAQAEGEVLKRELDRAKADLRVRENMRLQTATLSQPRSPVAWGAPVVSILVLGTFGTVMALALVRAIPPGSETILNMLLGSLAAMATSVVSYWVGSSAGSARKDEHLAQLTSGQQSRS